MVTPLIMLLRNRTTQYFNRVTLGILDYHIITPFTVTYVYRKHRLERSLLIFFLSIDLIWFISTPLSLHDIILLLFCFFTLNTVLFTGRTLTLLTILKLYSHTFIFTLHGSYLHYSYKQTGRTLTLLTILTLYLHLHLHCTVHTCNVYTSTNYNIYNTITNHLIRLQLAYLHF